MFRLLLKNFTYYWRSTVSVLLILIIIGLAIIYAFQTTEKMQIEAKDDLTDQWRTGYDLLVSPSKLNDNYSVEPNQKGFDASEVTDDQLVRRSDMPHYGGGISIEQYELIKEIEDIQVAAPLSFIGYIENEGLSMNLNVEEYGFYVRESTTHLFDGIRYRDLTTEFIQDGQIYQYIDDETMSEIAEMLPQIVEEGGWIPTSVGINPMLRTDGSAWSFAAIDPKQEALLVNMDESIVQGEYFSLDSKLEKNNDVSIVPLILLDQPYDVIFETTVYKIDVPENDDYETIINEGGADYLLSLPKEEIIEFTFNPYGEDYLYQFGHISYEDGDLVESEGSFSYRDQWAVIEYSPLQYNAIHTPLVEEIPVVEAIPQGKRGEQINYRNANNGLLNKTFGLQVIGRFDSNLLNYQFTTSDSPLSPDFYKPEEVLITHNVQGEPYDEPFLYYNSPYKSNYYTGGIDAITTLQAAEYLLGEEPISIIRVIVNGAGERSPENMAKVERVAEQIRERTDLQVDVMLGAADRKVHVLLDDFESVPGYGYLLEGWSQEGMSFVIEERVNTTNTIISSFIILMGLIGLSLVYRNYSNNRRRDIRVQHIFGWTKKNVILLLLTESITLLTLLIISLIVVILFGPLNVTRIWFALGVSMIGSILVIGLLYILPIMKTLKNNQPLTYTSHAKRMYLSKRPAQTLLSITIRQIMRHPARTLTKMLIIIFTLFYVTFFINTIEHASSMLVLTFLGERIDTNLTSFQWLLFSTGLLLAVFSYFAILINQMESRQKEIHIYQAWGWNRKKWTLLYLIEEILITGVAIVIGTLLSHNTLNIIVNNANWSFVLTMIVNVCILIMTITISLITLTVRTRKISLREFT